MIYKVLRRHKWTQAVGARF